ncbi:MAG: hypothetical protein O3C27_13580 [Actinomycetota bacterium]|nr:hypothetical protein [Actinomycetota bacterium]
MKYTATTIWEGTPEALLLLIEASKEAAPIHESFGAKNPRILQAQLGGQSDRLHYAVDFDSVEDFGKFADKLESSGWMAETRKYVAAAYPNLKMISTVLFANLM